MIQQEWLCNFSLHSVTTKTSLEDVKTYDGDFVAAQLASRLNTKYRNDVILATYQNVVCKCIFDCIIGDMNSDFLI